MADEASAAIDPADVREGLYNVSARFIGALLPRRAREEGWRDLLHEIEEELDWYGWDFASVLAMMLALYGRARLQGKDRERIATMNKRRTAFLKDVARLRKKHTAGSDGFSLIAIDGPRPEWERCLTGGKPGAWLLDEFLALVLVIVNKRWPDPPPWEGADPRERALTFALQVLRATGILPRATSRRIAEQQRATLRARLWRVLERGDLPPTPDDDHPLEWTNAVWQRLLEGPAAPGRRRALPPAAASPLSLVMEILVAAGGKLQYARVAFDPQFVEHLRRALPSPDLQISVAQAGLLEIIEKRGIPARLRRAALGEPPAGSPPDPRPSDDTRQ